MGVRMGWSTPGSRVSGERDAQGSGGCGERRDATRK